MGDVVELNVVTSIPVPPDKILQKALDLGITDVVVIGYDLEGGFYFASSDPDGGNVLWLLELAKRKLFACADEMGEPDDHSA